MEKSIGVIIKEWRVGEGLSQYGAAKKFGCSKSFLCQMEKGKKKPGPVLAVQIQRVTKKAIKARVLRPDLAELLAGV